MRRLTVELIHTCIRRLSGFAGLPTRRFSSMARILIEGLHPKKVSAHRGPPPWHRQSGKNRKMTAGEYRKYLARGVERSSVPTSERPRGGRRPLAALGFAIFSGAPPGGVEMGQGRIQDR